MTIKQLVEELTDKRIKKGLDTYKMLQHSLYVKILRKGKVIITNTPF